MFVGAFNVDVRGVSFSVGASTFTERAAGEFFRRWWECVGLGDAPRVVFGICSVASKGTSV